MELPAVIMGETGDDEPQVRLLPGRVPKSAVLYPAYAAVGFAAVSAGYFSLETGEWHPVMVLLGWGLLFCWYWVYGIAYHYRRRVMKYFAVAMSMLTAGSLVMISAVRGAAMAVPVEGELMVRDAQPLLFLTAALTTLSVAALLTHIAYLGRGYRQKPVDDDNGND